MIIIEFRVLKTLGDAECAIRLTAVRLDPEVQTVEMVVPLRVAVDQKWTQFFELQVPRRFDTSQFLQPVDAPDADCRTERL